MIKELGLTGVLFTADALHCQKNYGGKASCWKARCSRAAR
jgi:hypothetical protein